MPTLVVGVFADNRVMLRPRSDTLVGVVIGALLTGAFLLANQALTANNQLEVAARTARAQADGTRSSKACAWRSFSTSIKSRTRS